MRKPISVGIIVFLLVFVCGITFAWFIEANHIKKKVAEHIETLNNSPVRISYEDLSVSGFPTDILVTIKNPRLTGRMDLLIPPMEGSATPPAEWMEDMTLNGDIQISATALSNEYRIQWSGPWQNNSTIGGTSIALAQSNNLAFCSIKLADTGGWLAKPESFHIDQLEWISCSSGEFSIQDQKSGTMLMRSGSGQFYVSQEIKDNNRGFRVYLKFSDVETLPEGDAIFDVYANALGDWYPYAGIQTSLYGKQNGEIDILYEGPLAWTNTDIKKTPFSLRTNRFALTNNAYTSNILLDVRNEPSATLHRSHMALKMEGTNNENYDKIMQQMLYHSIVNLYKTQPLAYPALARFDAGSLYTTVAPALPNFQSLGNIILDINTSYQGDSNFTEGNITLGAFEASATPYGITAKGMGSLSKKTPIPAINIQLTCRNCLHLIDDLFNYASRLQKVAEAFGEDAQAMPPIDPQMPGRIKSLATAIAAPSGNDFTYTINSDATGTATINGKTLLDIMALYQQSAAPTQVTP